MRIANLVEENGKKKEGERVREKRALRSNERKLA
jgi:hypothetical protein